VSDIISKISSEKAQAQLESGAHQEIPSTMKHDDFNRNEITKLTFNINKVHHDDFLREDRGDAAVRFGDDGYSEEMGGGSQAMHDLTKKSTELAPDSRSPSCSTLCEVDEEEISGEHGLVKKGMRNLKKDQKTHSSLKAQLQILDNKSTLREKKQVTSTKAEIVNNDYKVMQNVPEKLGQKYYSVP